MNNEARVLLYDLEVSREIVEGYRGYKFGEFSIVKVVRPQTLMCYAWKWSGEKHTHFRSFHAYDTYKEFVETLRDLQSEADITIAHNQPFDGKMSNRFFIKEGIEPASPYRQIDTLQVARSVFKFPGNGLKALGEYLELGSKEKITYADLEDDFMSDNPKWETIKLMEKYNKTDVELMERIYLKMRPFMKNHPNLSTIHGSGACTVCLSNNIQYRGYTYTNMVKYRRISCIDCGKWSRERAQDKDEQTRPEFV